MALAGFSPGQAEALRRAMSRKRSREAMLGLWREFLDGARGRGVDDEITRTVFRKLIGFSNFGFPKAHSAAFAVLAYQSAWLRRRYPAEFLAALLNAQPMGFDPPATLVRDAQRRGVRVLPPCIRRSQATCTVEDGAVRIGLGYVREVRREAAERLTAERAAGGPFRDMADLAARADLRREQLAQLVRAGACDDLDRPRRAMLWELGMLRGPARGPPGCRWPCRSPRARLPPSPSPGASSAPSPTTRPPGSPPAGTWWRWCAPGCRPACSPPPSCARRPTARGCAWPGWWWPASGPRRPGGSCSCCWRTRPG